MTEDQNSYPDVYHLTLDIFLKPYLYFNPILNMPRLIYFEPKTEVKEFTAGFFFDIGYFWIYDSREDLLCINYKLKLDAI